MTSRLPHFGIPIKSSAVSAITAMAALLVSIASPPSAFAAGITTGTAYYRLTSTQNIPVPASDSSAPEVIASVLPPGSIVPPTQADGTQISPLTILNTSSGFDSNKLIVALKDNAADASTGTAASQLFGLSFFGSGFTAAGGHLDFALNIDNTLKTPPVLQSMTPGITITSIPDPTLPSTPVTTANNAPSVPNVTTPEPLSIAIWSAFVGIGLVRARRFRTQRAPSVLPV